MAPFVGRGGVALAFGDGGGWRTTTYSMRERMGCPSRNDGVNLVALTALIAASVTASGVSRGARESSTADSTAPRASTTSCRATCVSTAGAPTGNGTTIGVTGSASTTAAAAGGATSKTAINAVGCTRLRRRTVPVTRSRWGMKSIQRPLAVVQTRDRTILRLARRERVDEPVGGWRVEGDRGACVGGERGHG